MDRIGIKPPDYGGQREAGRQGEPEVGAVSQRFAAPGRQGKPGRQTERRRQARRRARRRAFFLAAAELAAGVCMTMAVMAMVIPEKREPGLERIELERTETGKAEPERTELERIETGKVEPGRAEPGRTESERIEADGTEPGWTGILYRIVEETSGLQKSIRGEGEYPLSFWGNPDSVYTGPPVIAVDAGHGGEDEGASREDVMEKDINLAIAGRLKVKLEDMGYTVMMVREDDTYHSKEERVEAAYKVRASAYVSIHQNTWEDAQARGIETWYSGKDGAQDSRRLAALVHKETVRSTGAEARELRGDSEFTVTSQTLAPACLIETGFLSNPRERECLADPEYQEKLAGGIAKGIDLYFNPKTMYLTFDDGPSAENTSAVLDVLKARNIKATFFVVGENVRKHPDVAKRIVAEGHTIGIHCNRHDYKELYESRDSYLADFEEAYRAVLEVTGVRPVLYRFPGGSINGYNRKVYKEIIDEMDARGFIYFDWNASLDDALKKSQPQELIDNANKTTLGRQQVVLLAHDMVHSTSLCLDGLIDQLPEYRMEPLTPEVAPVRFKE